MTSSHLGSLFQPDPSAPPNIAVRQGVVQAWDTNTGENSVQIAGGTVVNIPSLTAEAAELVAGDVVAVLTSGDTALVLGKVTTPGDPGTVPTWNADLQALAPLTDLAAVTTGTTITGATVESSTTGVGVVVNDPDVPNSIAFRSGEASETSPGRIWTQTTPGNATLVLDSPKISGGNASQLLLTRDSTGDGYVQGLAPHILFIASTLAELRGPANRIGNGTDYVTITGKAVTGADLSDPTNVFPATMVPRVFYKTADTTINNSTTLATDPELQVAGIAAGSYAIDALIIYSSSAVADWKGWMTATGSITDRLLTVLREPLSGNEYGISEGAVTFAANGNGVGVKRAIRIIGTFRSTAAGQAYNLQWAQNTAEATDTVVHKGSFLRIVRIA